MYIPSVGWAVYGGELLKLVRQLMSYALNRLFTVESRIPAMAIVIAGLVLVLASLHSRERVKTSRLFESAQPPSRQIAAELLAQQPTVKAGARLLFVNDPFPKDQYFLVFLTRLLYDDMTLDVTRTAVRPVPPAEYAQYDTVFVFDSRGMTFRRLQGFITQTFSKH